MTNVAEQKGLTMEEVLNFIDNMKVLELAEFVKKIEERYGVSAAAPVMAQAAAAGPAAVVEEKTSFDVILSGVPADKKIQVIKVVREITSLGLKEAKDLVESVPKPIKTGISKEESDTIKSKLEAVGGVVEVK